jgi:HTH-type transcriptional regulator, sugar sensing transcriptional regulator
MMEEIDYNLLEDIGLTKSEIKVYLALLETGTASKNKLLKHAKIASSKVYEIIDKLVEKGLCSVATINGIKNFTAAHPSRIKDYLTKRKEDLSHKERILEEMMPKLESLHSQFSKEVNIEVFIGWKGLETVYTTQINTAKKGDEGYIIGAGTGNNQQKLELFYTKYGKIAFEKGLKIKVIFNEDAKQYVSRIENNLGRKYNKRFLLEHTPSELL